MLQSASSHATPRPGCSTFVEAEWLAGGQFSYQAITLSPDGRDLYAAEQGQLITTFARDGSSGALTRLDTIAAATAVHDAETLAVSPDGRFLFSTGFFGVASFGRDPITGSLTVADLAREGESGISGLRRGTVIVPSADGAHVYVGSVDLDSPSNELSAVFVFAVDLSDGTLSLVQRIAQDDPGVTGLEQPWNLDVSPDGANVYVSGPTDDIAGFARDATTGAL
jgi:6-phosphogluconolactonase (cycloisomerase 2 family)